MRPELIHPMLVHFPIALLLTGLFVRLCAIAGRKRSRLSFLLSAAWLILALGVISAWVAVIAGEFAADIVAPTLDNLKVLSQHSTHAYFTAVSFTLGLLVDFTRAYILGRIWSKRGWIKNGLCIVFWCLYLFGLGNLIATGVYGGRLVYEQGAAVNR